MTSTGGTPFLAFRPLLSDFVLSMPRGAAVVYPKDAAMIVGYADVQANGYIDHFFVSPSVARRGVGWAIKKVF